MKSSKLLVMLLACAGVSAMASTVQVKAHGSARVQVGHASHAAKSAKMPQASGQKGQSNSSAAGEKAPAAQTPASEPQKTGSAAPAPGTQPTMTKAVDNSMAQARTYFKTHAVLDLNSTSTNGSASASAKGSLSLGQEGYGLGQAAGQAKSTTQNELGHVKAIAQAGVDTVKGGVAYGKTMVGATKTLVGAEASAVKSGVSSFSAPEVQAQAALAASSQLMVRPEILNTALVGQTVGRVSVMGLLH